MTCATLGLDARRILCHKMGIPTCRRGSAAGTQHAENTHRMQIEMMPIGELRADPANVRKHSKRNIAAICASLARFGQQKPIVIDADNVVRAGNGTLAAALELRWSELAVVRTGLAGAELSGFGIADNRTAELAAWSDELAPLLREVTEAGVDLDALGFSEAELARLLDVMPSEFPVYDDQIKTQYRCPGCGYEWNGSPRPSDNKADDASG